MRLHIIIPVINEAENLRDLLPFLYAELSGNGQFAVADGGSTDDSEAIVAQAPGTRYLSCHRCGRAQQMNEAVAASQEAFDAVYFVHADTRPPQGFYQDIKESINAGFPVGCYRFKFDTWHPMLMINAYFTRFKGLACRGGDQSLYLTTEAFHALGGFRDMKIMEDYDIIQRMWAREFPFRVIPRSVTVSARKYRVNGWFKVQMANLKVFRMYKAGAPEEAMVAQYRKML
jgi:rSAM/selenodomain-associated transferase 2